jgi:hypothetical protein
MKCEGRVYSLDDMREFPLPLCPLSLLLMQIQHLEYCFEVQITSTLAEKLLFDQQETLPTVEALVGEDQSCFLSPQIPDVGLPPMAESWLQTSPQRMHTPILLSGFFRHAIGNPLILHGEQGHVSLETVTSEGCHPNFGFPSCSDTRLLKLSWYGSTHPGSLYVPACQIRGLCAVLFRGQALCRPTTSPCH